MPTTIFDNIKGSEIPPPWLKKAKETPNTTFKVTLEPIKQQSRKVEAFQDLLDFKPIKGNLKPAAEIIRELRNHEE